ncbi:MAG: hypothetical protein QM500_15505 [Methylococcales bacterium]
MAYSRENHLKKVVIIQEIYLEHRDSGLPNRAIFKLYIKPRFVSITERTFYKYLSINAKKELTQLKKIKESQMTLF